MKRSRSGYTARQWAYAQNVLSGKTKKQSALDSGYSMTTANKAKQDIEDTGGFSNAMNALASKAGNVALAVMHKLGETDRVNAMTTRELLESVAVLSTAFVRFTPKPEKDPSQGNVLRDIFVKQIQEKKE